MEWQLGKIVHTQWNFFGPVDRKQLHWGFQHMLRSNIKAAQQKWNFNFLQDVPIEGFLQWEELGSGEVPAFHHSCVVRETQRPLQHLNRPLCREKKGHQLVLEEKPKASKQTGAGKDPEWTKRRQTDYYSGKKRVRTNMQRSQLLESKYWTVLHQIGYKHLLGFLSTENFMFRHWALKDITLRCIFMTVIPQIQKPVVRMSSGQINWKHFNEKLLALKNTG